MGEKNFEQNLKPFKATLGEDIFEEKNEKKEDIELTKYQQAQIEQKFSEFNIDKKDINEIEDFNQLSYGQRLLVLDNLKQLTLGRIREEALIKNKAEITGAGFLEKIWKGISKKYQIAKIEKESAREIEKGGIKAHGEVLKQLVKGTDHNLEVVENNDGELEIKYASGFKNLELEEQQKVDAFNEIATAFSKIPYEWSLETASKDQQTQFNKIKEEYEKAKGNILIIKEQKSNKEEAFLYMSGIDGKLRLNQFLNTHPEVEKELENIKSPLIWVKVLNDIITERGLLFGAGFAVRTATMSLVGTIGLPITAAVMGGYMGRKRAKESLKERELMARKGTKDISQEAKNIVTAESLSEKINFLINKIQSNQDEKNKAELLKSLEARLYYTQEKLDSGLVNFGSADKRFLNQYNLIDRLNLGFSHTPPKEDFVLSGSDEIELRLENFLALKERNISEAQKKYLWNQTRNGAIMGAAFATAGYAVKHFMQEFHLWDKIWGTGGVKSSNVSSVVEYPKSVGIGKAIVPEQPTLPSDSHIETSAAPEILEIKKLEDLSNSAIIQKGEGIEHAFIRQLSDNPGKFGFKGNLDDTGAVKQWANNEAHRLAIKTGYIDLKTGHEIRIKGEGGNIAYELEKDSDGNIKVNEYLEKDKGIFSKQESHEMTKNFKSAKFETDKESYEYNKPKTLVEKISPEILTKEDIDNYTKKQLETEIKESSARLAIQQKEIDIENIVKAGKASEKTFDLFNQQKTISEKWKIIQEYQYDIDSMKGNLAKFEDLQIKASMQVEIDRLENIKKSFIDRLVEQTTPVTKIPQSVEMVEMEKSEMDEKTAEIFSGLSSGKQEILNSLFENKTANEFSISDVEKLAEKIKIKDISVENFIKYIETIGEKKLSFKDMSNLKNNFKIINEWPQAGKAQEYINSKGAIQVIIQKMLSK